MAGNDAAASIQACALRVTRLAADGSTPAGTNNMIVTSGIISLELSQVREDGEEFTVKNGCGGIAYTYKDQDRLKRLDATLTITNPDVELAEMLTGGSLVTAGGQSIGYSAPAVGGGGTNGVCLEVWSKAWIGGGQPPGQTYTDFATTNSSPTLTSASAGFTSADVGRTISGTNIPGGTTILSVTSGTTATMSANATGTGTGLTATLGRPGAYWRWVFPKFIGAMDDFTLENDVRQQAFVGPCYENSSVGNGPNNDFPSGLVGGRVFSYFRDSGLPSTATVGYQSTPAQV